MAATPVKMIVKDCDDREVLAINYEFTQEVGNDGQMIGIPRGGIINVVVKALNSGKSDLAAWMLNSTDGRDVEIDFNETKSGKLMKAYKAQGAYCIGYTEDWQEGVGHIEKVTMTCQNIDFNGVKFENAWA